MEYINLGKIVNTHALKGEVRILSKSDFKEECFVKGEEIFVKYKQDYIPLTISNYRKHKSFDLLKFDGYEHINEVEQYKGSMIYTTKNVIDSLEEDEFMQNSLIDMEVYSKDNELLGRVTDVKESPAHEILVVNNGSKEFFVPFVNAFVLDVDEDNNKIIIKIIEGLI